MNFKIKSTRDKLSVKDYIDRLPEGKEYDVSIKKKQLIRTFPQNRLYWLWMTCIQHETGNDKNELHEYFKETYLPKEQVIVFNRKIEITVSTTGLDTAQFKHYLDRIQQFASSELGIVLPTPEDLAWASFYDYYKDRI